jgi:hypothetical protein
MKQAKFVLGFVLLFSFSSIWAVEAPTPPGQDEVIENSQEQTDSGLNEVADEETETEIEPDETEISPARVIPTEQISQDLGVSFPVDI